MSEHFLLDVSHSPSKGLATLLSNLNTKLVNESQGFSPEITLSDFEGINQEWCMKPEVVGAKVSQYEAFLAEIIARNDNEIEEIIAEIGKLEEGLVSISVYTQEEKELIAERFRLADANWKLVESFPGHFEHEDRKMERESALGEADKMSKTLNQHDAVERRIINLEAQLLSFKEDSTTLGDTQLITIFQEALSRIHIPQGGQEIKTETGLEGITAIVKKYRLGVLAVMVAGVGGYLYAKKSGEESPNNRNIPHENSEK